MTKGRWEYWLRQELLRPIVSALQPVLYVAAFIWRRLLFRTTFIAVTGSLGKTTAKECLASILASRGRTFRSYRNQNATPALVLNLLRVRPWHRFAVLEVAAGRPGVMRRSANLVRPNLAIVLNVLRTHTTAFRDQEEHAQEKRLLLEALDSRGLAVLNRDDPLVKSMTGGSGRRAVFFGTTQDCDYRAEHVAAAWPDRLTFEVHCNSTVQAVQTQLVGAHWLGSALAALVAANALGVSLPQGAELLRSVEPFPGRLQPVRIPSGAIVLRDDYNASIDTIETSLRILEEAKAPRRLLVITDMSDLAAHRRNRLKYLAGRAPVVAEVMVLVGEMAEYGKRRAIEAGMQRENVHTFPSIRAAAEFLRRELRPNDLMLLKGRTTDHAARIFFAQLGAVGCWTEYCPKRMLCDICWKLDITPEQSRTARVVRPLGSDQETSRTALDSRAHQTQPR
jgi:UDP-N-acetylmuramoyl-tripeptide--D-alanyl-D-alanine ligase